LPSLDDIPREQRSSQQQQLAAPGVAVGIPSNFSDTIEVPTTKDTNTRKTTGNKKYHPGRSRKKDPSEILRIPLYITTRQTTPIKPTFFSF
jgi:hypothetical protein